MTQVKQNKSGCGCLPLTLFAVVSIGAGFYFGKNLFGSELTPKSSAKITPQSAFVTSYISTDAQTWSQLSEFAPAATQKMIGDQLESFAEQTLKQGDHEINYEKDIAPWIGGISLTVLPSNGSEIDLQPVAILGVKNKFQAWRFFSQQEKLMEEDIEKTKYKNIAVYQVPEYKIWATMFANYLVISKNEQGIQAIIDTYKGAPAVTDLSEDQNLNLSDNPVMQIHLPEYDRFLSKAIEDFYPYTDTDKLSELQLGKVNSLTMNFNIEDYGFNFKTIVNLTDKTAIQQNQLDLISNDLLNQVPQETILMLSGGNIDKAWQNIQAERQNIPELDEVISQAENFLTQWLKLDLERNFISWLNGEFVVAISSVSNTEVQGNLLIESSDQEQGNITLNQLSKLAQSIPYLNVQKTEIEGINVTEFNSLGKNILSYGWLNNNNLLLTFGQNFQDIVNLNQDNSLLNNETFKLTTQSLPPENYGYFYLDLEQAIAITNRLNPNFFDDVPPEIKAMSESLKAIAITSSAPDKNTAQLDINLSVNKNN
jgi:hypothetical protein